MIINIVFLWLYKMELFPFQNNPKNPDPSYKMDLNFLGLFRKGNAPIIAKFHGTDLVTGICSHLREGINSSYSRINMVIELLFG